MPPNCVFGGLKQTGANVHAVRGTQRERTERKLLRSLHADQRPDTLPESTRRRILAADCIVLRGNLFHHFRALEQVRDRGAPVAPLLPGIIRPVFEPCAFGGGGVIPEGL
jgi:hypothetical protein